MSAHSSFVLAINIVYFKKLNLNGGCMKYRYLIILMPLLLSGCFWDANIDTSSQNTRISYLGNIVPNENAEVLIERAFRKSTVQWDDVRLKKIYSARTAITTMGQYMKEKLDFNSSIRYYDYKFWFEFTANKYQKLQNELDARVGIEGAISDEGKELYLYARRDINTMLEMHRAKIAATEKSIEDKASADTIQDMKDIYAVIEPLVKMVL